MKKSFFGWITALVMCMCTLTAFADVTPTVSGIVMAEQVSACGTYHDPTAVDLTIIRHSELNNTVNYALACDYGPDPTDTKVPINSLNRFEALSDLGDRRCTEHVPVKAAKCGWSPG